MGDSSEEQNRSNSDQLMVKSPTKHSQTVTSHSVYSPDSDESQSVKSPDSVESPLEGSQVGRYPSNAEKQLNHLHENKRVYSGSKRGKQTTKQMNPNGKRVNKKRKTVHNNHQNCIDLNDEANLKEINLDNVDSSVQSLLNDVNLNGQIDLMEFMSQSADNPIECTDHDRMESTRQTKEHSKPIPIRQCRQPSDPNKSMMFELGNMLIELSNRLVEPKAINKLSL